MITKTHAFTYKNEILIERAIVKPPLTHERIFQNQGCFMYIKNADATFHSSQEKVKIESKEAILFQCDAYFIEFLNERNEDEVEVIAIHLYPDILKQIYENELPNTIIEDALNTQSKKIVDSKMISKFIESLDFYFENPSLVNDDLLELKIKELVLLLIQSKNIESVLELIKNLYTSRLTDFKDIIALHTYSNLGMEELALLCQMSLSSFMRAFKKEFETTPIKYITNKRLKKAENLLRNAEMTISEIAFETGYNDPQYFTRIFKKNTGKTPTEFRAQHSK
ncbi:AraC family transcriptional regulator [Putridiphycobacter roseus]|uniref:AraC family transcriptional regulator n=1 Tax=Putridiphycobacter roseus TaxID=2219161 RepID=A0A2W1NFI2_9FLAO|nr:helix-turn-helix domain-containing protein [Putridiphycobacter roseus]PZE18235.1 AraC family transcriptional regulator [Putridiphycobacter roseus]